MNLSAINLDCPSVGIPKEQRQSFNVDYERKHNHTDQDGNQYAQYADALLGHCSPYVPLAHGILQFPEQSVHLVEPWLCPSYNSCPLLGFNWWTNSPPPDLKNPQLDQGAHDPLTLDRRTLLPAYPLNLARFLLSNLVNMLCDGSPECLTLVFRDALSVNIRETVTRSILE